MYFERADLWPVVTPPEAYAEEMELWRAALGSSCRSLLDLGTGGGHHLWHLLLDTAIEATAVDLSEPMLALSRRLNSRVEHVVANMLDLRLERKFDAVTIHDSLTYLTSQAEVEAVFATARHHLEPGGVLLFAPDYLRDHFDGPYSALTSNQNDEITVTLTHYQHDPDPDDNLFEAIYVYFVQRGGQLETFQERQTLGLFDQAQWTEWVRRAGFEVELLRYDLWEQQTFLFRATAA